jgi:hypothetical protein
MPGKTGRFDNQRRHILMDYNPVYPLICLMVKRATFQRHPRVSFTQRGRLEFDPPIYHNCIVSPRGGGGRDEAPLADPSWESENVEPFLGGGTVSCVSGA